MIVGIVAAAYMMIVVVVLIFFVWSEKSDVEESLMVFFDGQC